MKKTLVSLCMLSSVVALFYSCGKSGGNNYTLTDYTTGMTNTRQWTGNINGFAPADSVVSGITKHNYPVHYNRNISDTSFAVLKIDGYDISILGSTLPMRGKNLTTKTITFDSAVSGSFSASLIYFYERDSMSYVYSRVDSYRAEVSQYYQENRSLHTHLP